MTNKVIKQGVLYNESFANKKGFSEEHKDLLQKAYTRLYVLLNRPEMYVASPREAILEVHKQEHLLQFLWGFEFNSTKYHYEYSIKGCTCARMDNRDLVGTGLSWISEGCPIHSEDNYKNWSEVYKEK